MATLAEQWRDDLASWAIPPQILQQAPESPWIHPVTMFTVIGEVPDSRSHARAREALPEGGSVLDIGCGGGRASMALGDRAGLVIGVDSSTHMLAAFAAAAAERGLAHQEIEGSWPAVASAAPIADVVVCHHVVYNVADIVPFLRALHEHAHHRVVLELPMLHPLSSMNPLWKQFWDLDRPTRPSASDLVAILEELGFQPEVEIWQDPDWGARVSLPEAERVRYARIRLCLDSDRDAEVAAALLAEQDARPREVATVWWDRV